MTQAQRDIPRKLSVLEHAAYSVNVSKTCRYFGVSRDSFYRWKRDFAERGEDGLINSKPCQENPTLRTPQEIVDKVLYLRKTYHIGQQRIAWYLMRYHGIKIASAMVYNILKRHGLNRLPRNITSSSSPKLPAIRQAGPGTPYPSRCQVFEIYDPAGAGGKAVPVHGDR